MDPLSMIAIGLPLMQAVGGFVGRGKANREHDAAYSDLMAQSFGSSASAKKYMNEPISRQLLSNLESQINRTLGSGISALGKGDSRSMGQIGNVMNQALDANTDVMQMGQQYYADAMKVNAGQEFAGRQQKQDYMAQNVAGLAQREMQQQMNINAGLTGAAQNAASFGLRDNWFGGGGGQDSFVTDVDTSALNSNPRFDMSQNAFGRGALGGGFNQRLQYDFDFGNTMNLGFPSFIK